MQTQKVITRVRKALVMMVAAMVLTAFSAAPAFASPMLGVRADDSVMGVYDPAVVAEMMDVAEALLDEQADPAIGDGGADEMCPEPSIPDGGDWEMVPRPEIVDGGADEMCPDPQYPEGDGSDVVTETPQVPQGGQEETPTDTPQGDESTPTAEVPEDGQDTPDDEGGSLPFTGGNGSALAMVGLGAILAGIAVLALRRRAGQAD